MTLGDGVFWSTVLLLLAVAAYQISIRGKWTSDGEVAYAREYGKATPLPIKLLPRASQ
jgi:hypothetical protein